MEYGENHNVNAKIVINATGVFTDFVRRMDDIKVKNIMTSSQGVHLVLDKSFLSGSTGIMVPHTDDGRVLFAVPWNNRTLIGTTDTFVDNYPLEPIPLESEITFLLEHAARYLTKDPVRADVKSVFAGLRPLVKSGDNKDDTASISRDHTITISKSGLITICGGKWTTYRKMAEDTIEQAITQGNLAATKSITDTLQIRGYHNHADNYGALSKYGSDANKIEELLAEEDEYRELLHPNYKIVIGEIIWSIRQEKARNIEDFLVRRTQLLLLDAKASIEAAPAVAKIMAKELGQNRRWQKNQVQQFIGLAKNYLCIIDG